MNNQAPIWKRDAEKIKKRLETAKEITRKKDTTGGGYLSEYEYCRHMSLVDPYNAFFGLYNLGFMRGYKRGREDAKAQHNKK